MAYGVTKDGFIVKDFKAILEDYHNLAKTVIGPDVDLSDYSPYEKIFQIDAYVKAVFWQILEEYYYQLFVDFAEGVNLDRLASLLMIRRKPAERATGTVKFSRSTPATSKIVIPAGTRVSDENELIVFQTLEDAVINEGEMEVEVPVEAVYPGKSGNVTSNVITKMINPIAGIEKVTNENPMTGGLDAETDEEFRWRIKTHAPYNRGTKYSIESSVLQVEGVTEVVVIEDSYNHTANVVVVGGEDNEISEAIEYTRPCGIEVTWQRPNYVEVSVGVTVKPLAGYDVTTVHDNVVAAIQTYILGLKIGDNVTYSDLAKAIVNADGVDDVLSLTATAGETTIDSFGEEIEIGEIEKAANGTHTVDVVA